MPGALLLRPGAILIVATCLALIAAACAGARDDAAPAPAAATSADAALLVVTTVSPLRNIVQNVAGDRARVIGLVPEGVNSHTFEPPPSAAQTLAQADLIVINGLNLELPTLELARANAAPGVPILLLADHAIREDDYVFDFSFPADQGDPNPHLWTDPNLALRYAELIRDALAATDPAAAPYYSANLDRFRAGLRALDAAIAQAAATVPDGNRKLLTYHDSFPFFAPRYGFEIIGAIQPSDFSQPSPREVASLVDQIRASGVPAIFGSEVFRSEVLNVIAAEAGAVQVSTLRDDDLPGDPGDPHNTYLAMMAENVRTLALTLGGDPAALDPLDLTDTWRPYAAFTATLRAPDAG